MRAIRTVPWMLLKFHQRWDRPQNSITPTELTTGLSAGSDQISSPHFSPYHVYIALYTQEVPRTSIYQNKKGVFKSFVLVKMLLDLNKHMEIWNLESLQTNK